MTESNSKFVWPSAATLVRRAERELKIVSEQPVVVAADVPDAVDRFTELVNRLFLWESGYIGLHPPGYESGGRLAPVRRFVKKVSRRLMWWYVEPRWTVHREMTANLAAFNHATIDLVRSVSAELEELRARVTELEGLSRPLASPSHLMSVPPETQLTYDSDPMS